MHNKKSILLPKIQNRDAQIGAIGLGYVGLPQVIAFYKAGFLVAGFDFDYRIDRKAAPWGKLYKHITLPDFKKQRISFNVEPLNIGITGEADLLLKSRIRRILSENT